jgi:hypothetical protein
MNLFLVAGVATARTDFHYLTFSLGGGYTTTTQGIQTRLDRRGNAQVGVGINLTRHLGVQGTFMFNDIGIKRSALEAAGQPDGTARVYSFTIDPKFTVWSTESASAYVLGEAAG